ncbi:MAG: 23S rRNA (cytidine(2498)-2'-O)-methyltransferase RlmM [Thiohalophilus sp.]|jgi:23S rRNA (cytidine2498-2'-O)-methyltransferase
MPGWLLYTRPGFENECAAEIQTLAAEQGISGYCKARPDSGYVLFNSHESGKEIFSVLSIDDLIFARQWFAVWDLLDDLPLSDRVSPIVRLLQEQPLHYHSFFIETPDTNTGKELQKLCRSIAGPLQRALDDAGLIDPQSDYRLHLCFLSTHAAYTGYAPLRNSSALLMGIPRLRASRQAPSRSALKLEEAILRLMSKEERQDLMQSGMHAVDLGAAPGGWTWQLVQRHFFVVAVDNGPMQQELLESGQVEQVREDGFRYQPSRPVDWMVCDIVDKPKKVTAMVIRWLVNGWCRQTIFNLKLPMKKRYQELQQCLVILHDAMAEAGIAAEIRCKQLYHDREEVTVCVIPADR